MLRYFFDIDDGGQVIHDDDGLELDGPDAARREAMRTLGDLARDDLREGIQHNLTILVRTEADTPIFRADLSVTIAWMD